MKAKLTILFCAVAMLGAVLGLSTGTAAADGHDYPSAPESPAPAEPAPAAPAPAPAPAVAVTSPASTGVIVTAENGFSSLVNGNTDGKLSGQATSISPLNGDAHVAAGGATELAHTGGETLLAYAGLGLIAAGAIAMGTRRRLAQVHD